MMKSAQIRELSLDEMQARISELEEERFRLRFRSATESLNDPLRLRVIRKDIARLKTIVKEQQTKAGAVRAGGR
jgi:large subunit ribosomal protein L29